MIINAQGDLLAADVDALVNTVNCVGVMGKGIALQFKRRYPDAFKVYEAACKRHEVTIGKMFVIPLETLEGPRWIVNFPTKKHWRSPSKMEYIDAGLADLRSTIREYAIRSIAIPPLGAGNGGLDWGAVEPRIRKALGDLDVEVHLYGPSKVPRTVAATRGRMTWGRAILMDLLDNYVARRAQVEPWEDTSGAAHLEIQKLMYFANLVEPRLKLRFEQGRYGPYSERVRHLIQEMEGSYLAGFGDGSGPALELRPIGLTELGRQELDRYNEARGSNEPAALVSHVMRQIEGFEGPYGLELLASTHWVLSHPLGDASGVAGAVRGWTRRKGRLFTDAHVVAAQHHLEDVGAA